MISIPELIDSLLAVMEEMGIRNRDALIGETKRKAGQRLTQQARPP
jgi:hypothetical protein